MSAFRFLSRVAFICNICFLLTSLVQYLPHPPEGPVISTIILMGYVLGILFNIIVNAWFLILLIARKPRATLGPGWLLIVNFIFFIVQLYVISTAIWK
ncbi:MAG TPA: hypothetical protein VE035_05270 [Puia sp.]|nr:hypothetical protein [Puia sp.]